MFRFKTSKSLQYILKKAGKYAILSALVLSLQAAPGQAQTPAIDAGCDPNFMTSLNKKAEMEAMRDVAMAQSHIKKPDSVFQLTCYDLMVSEVIGSDSQPGIARFSDQSSPTTDMTGLLNNSISLVLSNYITGNFNHDIMGGYPFDYSFTALPGTYQNPANHTISTIDWRERYNCEQMNKVWWHAKCLDFDDNDFFYETTAFRAAFPTDPFGNEMENITASPPGRLDGHTTSCATGPDQPWDFMVDVAFNEGDMSYAYRGFLNPDNSNFPPDMTAAPFNSQVPEPWFSLVLPGSCAAPILTGLQYNLAAVGVVNDGFCPNPGCTYDPAAGTCS